MLDYGYKQLFDVFGRMFPNQLFIQFLSKINQSTNQPINQCNNQNGGKRHHTQQANKTHVSRSGRD